jgi:hypothetical protein
LEADMVYVSHGLFFFLLVELVELRQEFSVDRAGGVLDGSAALG